MKIFTAPDDIKKNVCERILRSLPLWFGIEQAVIEYVETSAWLPMIVSSTDENETITGFISLRIPFPEAAEIYVMGVIPEFHRTKTGFMLVKSAEEFLKNRGVRFLQVKTLSPARESPEYEKTRLFYLSCGFTPLDEFPELWGPENPCLQLIKYL